MLHCVPAPPARDLRSSALPRVRLPVAAQQGNRISITTAGGTGGVYYPLGGGMANILSKYVPGMQATAEVTGGSVDNLKLIDAGKSEVGFSMVDAAWEAAQGLDKFKDSEGQRAHADGALPEPDAGRHRRRHRHHEAVGPEGQARVDRLAGQRSRSDGVARAGGGRPRPEEGHQAGAPGRGGIGQRDQGPEDRRVLLGRRRADGGDHRSGRHARARRSG